LQVPRLHQDRRARSRHRLQLRRRDPEPQADRLGRHRPDDEENELGRLRRAWFYDLPNFNYATTNAEESGLLGYAADSLLGAAKAALRGHRTWPPRSWPRAPTTRSARGRGRPACRWSAAPTAGRSTSPAATPPRPPSSRTRPRSTTSAPAATGCATSRAFRT